MILVEFDQQRSFDIRFFVKKNQVKMSKSEVTKNSTPRNLSIFMALTGMGIPLFLITIILFSSPKEKIVFILFACLLMFTINYIVYNYVLNTYIVKRMRPIYGRIEKAAELDSNVLAMEDKDMIADVDKKVMNWAKLKAHENKMLRENDVLRKEFIGNVAHELKTPIFNIQGYIDTLLDGGINDETINVKYLERTEKNVNRMITTIKDIDTITGLESGRLMLEYIDFDILEMIRDIFDLQDRLIQKYNITLELEHNEQEKVLVYADYDKVYEAVHNLVVNSLKYGSDGGRTFLSVLTNGPKVWVNITDNGIGIPSEHLPHIFTRFYRVDKSRSRDRGGSGLGLAIVKHIVEAHDQKITVDSTVGKGTTFRLSFRKSKFNPPVV